MNTASSQEPPLETVWLDIENRVASFHPVEGWKKTELSGAGVLPERSPCFAGAGRPLSMSTC